jgi:hypothetical protein
MTDLVTLATAFFNEQTPEQLRRQAQSAALPKRSFAEHLEEAINGSQPASGTNDTKPEAGYVA